ncbi:MAG: DUF222 domain-containing protein, partial [Gemmatimonadetes bacterium]|nr:DUF222 domain-containing protein [Gemmatimonadota bacterium]
ALARESTTAHLERVVRGWKLHNRLDEQALERLRHQSRCFSVFPDESGMYVVKGRLDPEVAAVLLRAVEAAADALYWKGPDPIEAEAPITPEQRRADAVGLLAERALAAGLDREGGGPEAPIHAARAERYQVMLHVDARTLAEQPEAASELRAAGWVQTADGLQTADAARPADDAQNLGADAVREDRSPEGSGDRSHLSDGQRVSAETSRRLACDAAVVRVTHDLDGSVLDVGRRRRTIPAALRRALEVRDGGCRFPGCGRRFTDAHHVRHWADGGETALPNLLLLCRFHHRRVHEDGYRVSLDPDGRAVFRRPDGALVPHLPPLTRGSTHELLALHEALGIRPDWRTAAVRRE